MVRKKENVRQTQQTSLREERDDKQYCYYVLIQNIFLQTGALSLVSVHTTANHTSSV